MSREKKPKIGAAGGENSSMNRKNSSIFEPEYGIAQQIILSQIVERLHGLYAHASVATWIRDHALVVRTTLFHHSHVIVTYAVIQHVVIIVRFHVFLFYIFFVFIFQKYF